MSDLLPFDRPEDPERGDPDEEARVQSVDPARNVVLEASAGTGKTRVLVDRYINLLHAGVAPRHILAITFTRKAAAEMRARILAALHERAARSDADAALWRETRDGAGDIAISTIDAFCLSLLREFPLEADLDPGFEMADETEAPRLLEEALDGALRMSRDLAQTDEYVRLVFAQLGEHKLRQGLSSLINRRLVVEEALEGARHHWPRDLTAEAACARAFERLRDAFGGLSHGLDEFLSSGPVEQPRYKLFAGDMRRVCDAEATSPPQELGLARAALDRIESHFLVNRLTARKNFPGYRASDCRSPERWREHRQQVLTLAPAVLNALAGFRRDLNAVLSRGVWRIYQIALTEYRRALDARGVLDFQEVLARALLLLRQMDEFARSRFRLESRYHHVLVDEFQDTSRAQWELVALLIRSWGEGSGLFENAPLPPSIFLVGDRKQSIYGFRDADVAVIEAARQFVDQLRPDGNTGRAISRSFRAVDALLSFVNDVCGAIDKQNRRDAFRYNELDRFPEPAMPEGPTNVLGMVAGASVSACAEGVAAEIVRLIGAGQAVRDPATGELRPVKPGDIGILFRTKEGHREFEGALEARGVPTYVYKGLGFFEADEIKDVVALVRYLARPGSDARAAAFLRSRFIRLSDRGLQTLAPNLAAALTSASLPATLPLSNEDRRVLTRARKSLARWLTQIDRVPPADLLEEILIETAYLFEIRGPRVMQARENLKKIRALVRRVQNQGYATLGRLSDQLERMSTGDESNAAIDAIDAVNLMTVHAAKGLEFPVVFVVNLTKGTGNRRWPIRVGTDPDGAEAWVSVGDFQSDADEDAKDREKEETKRLLYVALTRGRDRLYLVSEVKQGKWKPAPGSLGEVMPGSFERTFEAAAAAGPGTLEWPETGDRRHHFRVCSIHAAPADVRPALPALPPQAQSSRLPDDFSPLPDAPALERVAVTSVPDQGRSASAASDLETGSQALIGTAVHRLFELQGRDSVDASAPETVSERLKALIRDEEVVETDDLDAALRQAVEAYLQLRADPEVESSLRAGDAWFEVPFSVRPAGAATVLRGTFDCLIRTRDGRVRLLEFKTGRPSLRHKEQLAIYLSAARALFPETAVEGMLVYACGRNQTGQKGV